MDAEMLVLLEKKKEVYAQMHYETYDARKPN